MFRPVQKRLTLTDSEAKTVSDVVYAHKGEPISRIIEILSFIYEDISEAHYIAVGLAIGEMLATVEASKNFSNQKTILWLNKN